MREVTYLAALTPEAEGVYSVAFPDVPGAISQGDSFDDAVANAREALELILEAYSEDGEAFPVRSAPDKAARAIVKAGAVPVFISAAAPSKAARINITIDEGLLERVNRLVDAEGKSRSAFFAEAARAALREKA